ncbi:nitrous oxide reductase family maturation protein NosD [Methylocystis sp. IM3]|uniref:nitrous oxide reductase family maturation protein NosD n=2 Tax=unclassified Methylocystis TaxID=2625913 RepID=UPI0030F910C4
MGATLMQANMLALAFCMPSMQAFAAEGPAIDLQELVNRTPTGGVLHLASGQYAGPIKIDRPLILEGDAGANITASGVGSVITVSAPDATIRNLTIRGSGFDLEQMDSGIFLEQAASRARVEANILENNLFGIYVHGAEDAIVKSNLIVGNRPERLSEAGNGVTVWNAPGAQVLDNDIRFGRDGLFVISSRNNIFGGNTMRDLRYAVHYMYASDSIVSGNVSIGNHIGFAIMFSPRLEVVGNLSRHDTNYGLMFNFANYSTVRDNIVLDGPQKCLFIYDANFNTFYRNWFEKCDIGVHFTAGSEQNAIFDNVFIQNRTQVKYVGTRFVEWSKSRRGNYWSDNPAFDLDGDGIADVVYRPNDIIDRVIWTAPLAKMLANSPAVQLLRWAQSQFPVLQTGGVVDSAPLMRPIHIDPPLALGRLE